MNKILNKKEFITKLIDSFPDIAEEVMDEDYEGLLNLQIGVLTKFTQNAIDASNSRFLESVFIFIKNSLQETDQKVTGAIYTSFLEHLNFDKNKKAYNLMPSNLKSIFNQLNSYNKADTVSKNVEEFIRENSRK